MTDPTHITPLGAFAYDGDPVDEVRELAFWVLPGRTGHDDARDKGGDIWAIDRLARRYLRYAHAAAFPVGEGEMMWAHGRNSDLQERLERISVRLYPLKRDIPALDLVLTRAEQIINPGRFAYRPS